MQVINLRSLNYFNVIILISSTALAGRIRSEDHDLRKKKNTQCALIYLFAWVI